jgi:hypothetical protein
MEPLPQRPIAHVVGDEAVRLFIEACPGEWISAPLAPDYGLDVRVEIVREGRVTGEEFAAQVKGRRQVHPRSDGGVTAHATHPTVNYWLGKLNPTMIVLADTVQRRLWYGWLEHAYAGWPLPLKSDGKVELTLRSKCGPDFADAVGRYVSEWFARLRKEVRLLPDRGQLTRFSLHIAAVVRCLTQIHLLLTSGRSVDELQDPLHFTFLEFGLHDGFLLSLWEPDSPWREPLSSRVAGIISPKLEAYIGRRGHFWMREKRVTAGDFDLIPFSHAALRKHLLPTLETAWDLQYALNQLIVLGSVDDANTHGGGG